MATNVILRQAVSGERSSVGETTGRRPRNTGQFRDNYGLPDLNHLASDGVLSRL